MISASMARIGPWCAAMKRSGWNIFVGWGGHLAPDFPGRTLLRLADRNLEPEVHPPGRFLDAGALRFRPGNNPSLCASLRAALRDRRIASAFSRDLFSEGFS